MTDLVDNIAIRKAVLHGLKYINSDVLGYLVSDKANKKSVENAYPLSHTRVTSPLISNSLEILKDHVLSNSQQIVGIYESYNNYKIKGYDYITPIALRLAEVVKADSGLEKVFIVTVNFGDFLYFSKRLKR
jgi:hypothetical protein